MKVGIDSLVCTCPSQQGLIYLTHLNVMKTADCETRMQSLMLCGRMTRSQIRQRISEPPKILIDSFMIFIVLLICVPKNTQVLILPMVKSTHAISSLLQSYISPSSNLFFSVSLFLLLALFPDMFYLSSFHINTWQI